MEWMEEYAAICRQWARAQHLTENCRRQWLADRMALESELVRLRGALLVLRTAWLWGLKPHGSCWPRHRCATTAAPTPDVADRPSAAAVARRTLCRVGCQGQGHTWLGDDGQCRLLGTPCDGITANPALTAARP